jgi:hypothetical protein
MAGDDLQRRALASDLARRLQLASLDELCLIDAALTAIEQARSLQWERRIATGPGDVDRLFHIATPRPSRGVVETGCRGSWAFGDMVERQPSVPVAERCLECWRAVADHPIAVGLLAIVEDIVARDIERAELREAARREMLGEDLAIAVEPAPAFALSRRTPEARREYIMNAAQAGAITIEVAERMLAAADAFDAELTRSSSVPAQLALADVDQREPHEIEVDETGGESG